MLTINKGEIRLRGDKIKERYFCKLLQTEVVYIPGGERERDGSDEGHVVESNALHSDGDHGSLQYRVDYMG